MAIVGPVAHQAGVDRLLRSYAEIPSAAPVRLAKPTTNLFRSRTRNPARGLDVAGLTGVVGVDPHAALAEVQGMCTYEDLVDATLPHGLMPLVVPQLRSITLGGAVTGLGIESTSFRNGLPHESVVEMDVLTGDGAISTVKPGDPLFDAFPNSYGSLGYAVRLTIELERVPDHVALHHVRFDDADDLAAAVVEICEHRAWQGERVDALDGVAFSPTEAVLTLARWSDAGGSTSDYTGQEIYYRSLLEREHDLLTSYDYLWRWDTDWFWCSGAFGLHDPRVRRLWPRRWRRSDVYRRLVGLDERTGLTARRDRRRGVSRERVIQDVEVPVERIGDFVRWFDDAVGMRPVWLCPLRLREPNGPTRAHPWPAYPLRPGTTYVNAGFWGTVEQPAGTPPGTLNRRIEDKVTELGGHKSLYSEAYYTPETFAALYNTPHLDDLARTTDPGRRLTPLYEKAVRGR